MKIMSIGALESEVYWNWPEQLPQQWQAFHFFRIHISRLMIYGIQSFVALCDLYSGSLLAFINYIAQLPRGGGLGLCTLRSR